MLARKCFKKTVPRLFTRTTTHPLANSNCQKPTHRRFVGQPDIHYNNNLAAVGSKHHISEQSNPHDILFILRKSYTMDAPRCAR